MTSFSLRRWSRWLRIGDWGVQLPIVLLLSLAYFLAIDPDPWLFARHVTIVCGCQVLLLAGGYLANDCFDRRWDRLDPRREPMTEMAARARWIASVLFLAAGLAMVHGFGIPGTISAIAWGQVALGLAYSLPGIRLKERGVMGLLAAALLQRLPAFAMIVLAFPAGIEIAAWMSLWLAVLGMVTILEHQMKDEAPDRAAGVRTWCVERGRNACLRLRRALGRSFTIVTVAVAADLAWTRGDARGVSAALLMLSVGVGSMILARRRLQRILRPQSAGLVGAAMVPP